MHNDTYEITCSLTHFIILTNLHKWIIFIYNLWCFKWEFKKAIIKFFPYFFYKLKLKCFWLYVFLLFLYFKSLSIFKSYLYLAINDNAYASSLHIPDCREINYLGFKQHWQCFLNDGNPKPCMPSPVKKELQVSCMDVLYAAASWIHFHLLL